MNRNLSIDDAALWPSLLAEPVDGGPLDRYDVVHVATSVGSEAGEQYAHLVLRESQGIDSAGGPYVVWRTVDGESIAPMEEPVHKARPATKAECTRGLRRFVSAVIGQHGACWVYPISALTAVLRCREEETTGRPDQPERPAHAVARPSRLSPYPNAYEPKAARRPAAEPIAIGAISEVRDALRLAQSKGRITAEHALNIERNIGHAAREHRYARASLLAFARELADIACVTPDKLAPGDRVFDPQTHGWHEVDEVLGHLWPLPCRVGGGPPRRLPPRTEGAASAPIRGPLFGAVGRAAPASSAAGWRAGRLVHPAHTL